MFRQPALFDKIRFTFTVIFTMTCAYAAIAAYGQYQGFLDVRVYFSQEQAHQAQLRKAEAIIARDVFPDEEYVPAKPAQEHEYAQASAFDAVDHPRKHRR